jgi:hypothetical protein
MQKKMEEMAIQTEEQLKGQKQELEVSNLGGSTVNSSSRTVNWSKMENQSLGVSS